MSVSLRKNRHLTFVIGLIMIVSLLIGRNPAYAAETNNASEVPQIQIFINGENNTAELSSKGMSPKLIQDRTYLPIRAVAEQLGLPVLWVPESNSVYIGDLSQCPNPLLQYLSKRNQTPSFEAIKPENFIPALEYAMAAERQEIAKIINNSAAPSFTNTVEPLARMNMCEEIGNIMFALNGAENSDALQKETMDAAVLLTQHANDIFFNKALFDRVALVYQQADSENLTSEQANLLEKFYQRFVDNGINFSGEQQDKLRQIDSCLATLSSQFSANLLKDTNNGYVLITEPKELSGLPDYLVSTASQEAKRRGLDGWCFSMDYPTVSVFLSLADNREKRKEMQQESGSIGMMTPETDNREIVKEMVNLRLEKANILGFSSYADNVLTERMAKNTETVNKFLNELADAAMPIAQRDIREIEKYAQSKGLQGAMQTYDRAYYENRLRQEKYSFDEEALRPYFELNQVKTGVFELVKRLYGLRFVLNEKLQVYHPDVEAYEVYDENDNMLGIFYLDFFCREGKGSGAWSTPFRMQERRNGENIHPLINLVYNFPAPSDDVPALLSFYDVETFLHEFGHGLHVLLSDVDYASLSSFNVYWDFVELPSSIMENWAYEKEFLHLFAKDYKTGQPLPDETIDRINQMRTVLNASGVMGVIQRSMLDMAWHTITEPASMSVEDFENQLLKDIRLLPPLPGTVFSTDFDHLFDGGYAAGYYSYLWANVLDADAYQVFKQGGIMNPKTGQDFREMVLSRGASVDPMVLFKDFVGHEPSTDALLKREGLE